MTKTTHTLSLQLPYSRLKQDSSIYVWSQTFSLWSHQKQDLFVGWSKDFYHEELCGSNTETQARNLTHSGQRIKSVD